MDSAFPMRWNASHPHRPLPRAITVDRGTEFTSKVLDEWAYRRGVELDLSGPESPSKMRLSKSFNGRLRDECLNVHEFVSIDDVRSCLDAWRQDYDRFDPMVRSVC